MRVRAPRISACTFEEALSPVFAADAVADLSARLEGCTSVVNAAGLSDAEYSGTPELIAANAAMPGVLARAANRRRFVHVSSAAVQGRRPVLDDSAAADAFSPYSLSKHMGEIVVHAHKPDAVVYRPPGVHGPSRRITRAIGRVARSPLASVAAPGDNPTPQALIENVGDAVAFLAISAASPPCTVTHPSEGLTTSSLMELLGGKPPQEVPRHIARAVVSLGFAVSGRSPRLRAQARRLETLWFGQGQAASWLTQAGWLPVAHEKSWRVLGAALRDTQLGETD